MLLDSLIALPNSCNSPYSKGHIIYITVTKSHLNFHFELLNKVEFDPPNLSNLGLLHYIIISMQFMNFPSLHTNVNLSINNKKRKNLPLKDYRNHELSICFSQEAKKPHFIYWICKLK